MKISFEKQSKEEKEAKNAEKLEQEALAREATRTTVSLFIEKAKMKLGIAACICLIFAIVNEFILDNALDSSMVMIYLAIAIVTYIITRKEWKAAKIESEQ